MIDLLNSDCYCLLICSVICTLCKGYGQSCFTGSDNGYQTIIINGYDFIIIRCICFLSVTFVGDFQLEGFLAIVLVCNCGYAKFRICFRYCELCSCSFFFQAVVSICDGCCYFISSCLYRYCCSVYFCSIICFTCIGQYNFRVLSVNCST